jgi:hypothetical protein
VNACRNTEHKEDFRIKTLKVVLVPYSLFYKCQREDPNRLRSGSKRVNLRSAANAANALNPTDANEPAMSELGKMEEALASGSSLISRKK